MSGFCQKCMEMPGELQGETKGEMKKVGGIDSYVTQPGTAKGQILLAVDIFGFSEWQQLQAAALSQPLAPSLTLSPLLLRRRQEPQDRR